MSDTNIQNHEFSHVNISDDVIGIITNIAASEIKGITLQGSFAGDIAEILGKKNMTKGVRINITEDNVVTVDLNVIVDFGVVIPDVAWKVQDKVKTSIEEMTDLKVQAVNVNVQGINLEKTHEKLEE